MNEWLKLIISSLACYRLAQLIAIDEGIAINPLANDETGKGIFLRARARLGAYNYGPNGQAKTNIGRGISCPYCIGFWIAGFIAIRRYGFNIKTISYWLAIAGLQSFLQGLTGGR